MATDYDITHYISNDLLEDNTDYHSKNKEHFSNIFYGSLEDKPETEQKMFALQEEYLRTRSNEVWKEFYDITQSYMGSIIKKRLKNKKGFPKDELEDKVTQATVAFLSQYKTRKNFEVGASFFGLMDKKALEVLYKGKNDPLEKYLSIDTNINDSKTKVQDVLDISSLSIEYQSLQEQHNPAEAIQTIETVLDELDESLGYDPVLEVIARAYVVLFFRKPKSRHAKRLFLSSFAKTNQIERVLNRTILEIYSRLKSA